MREIKFRAWDKDGIFGMIYVSLGDFLDKPQEFEGGLQEFEIMQYTGLKDKNGKEIYEGDIIQWPDPEVCGIDRGPVVYGDGWFYADGWCGKGSPAYKECEVIGNIYENPELLEKPNERPEL